MLERFRGGFEARRDSWRPWKIADGVRRDDRRNRRLHHRQIRWSGRVCSRCASSAMCGVAGELADWTTGWISWRRSDTRTASRLITNRHLVFINGAWMRIANCPINTDFISVSSESGTGNECFQGDVGGLIACTFEIFIFYFVCNILSLSLSLSWWFNQFYLFFHRELLIYRLCCDGRFKNSSVTHFSRSETDW